MNSASATTITVNTSIFSASDVVEIANIGAGVCTITAGTCTVGTTGTLALAQNASGKLVFISASAAIFIAGDTGSTVRQVLSTTLTTAFTSGAAGAYANVTGLSVVITPATATNKILIMASVNGGTFMAVKLTGGNTATGYSVNSFASSDSAGNNDYVAQASMLFLDSPATTSAITYQVQSKDMAGGTSYINRSQNSATAIAASTITCMEIVA
jgi:hypothetical protein